MKDGEKKKGQNQSSGKAGVTVVETADAWEGDNPSVGRRLNFATIRRIHLELEMRPICVVVGEVITQNSFQMGLIQNDHVIQTFATDAAIQTLRVGVLPRTSRRREDLLDAHSPN